MLSKKNTPTKKTSEQAIADGDMEALKASLSYRQRRFAEEYIIDYNGTAAARRAGYNSKHIDRHAYVLLHHVGIAAYIDHLDNNKMAKIASIDPDYIIQKILTVVNKDGAKDADKLRGLELLARHLGMFIERTEITGKDGEAIRIEQQAKEEAEKFLTTLQSLVKRQSDKKEVVLNG